MLNKLNRIMVCLLLTYSFCNVYANELENQIINIEEEPEIVFDDSDGDGDDNKQQVKEAKKIESTEQKPMEIRAIN